MQKICFVQPRAYYLFNAQTSGVENVVGGAQKQSYLYSIELAKHAEFDVYFAVADFGQKDLEIIDNVKVWKTFNFKDNLLKKTISLFKILKKISAKTYIFRSADFGVAVAILYVKLFLRKKVLYMISGDAEVSFKRLKKRAGLLTAVAMPLAYKVSDIISAQSELQYKFFAENRNRKPDFILKNIISVPKIANNLKKEKILWVGRLDKVKNPELFIELAEKFPNEQFVLIAPIVREHVKYGNEIKQKAQRVKNIEYIDYVSPGEINKFYAQAKIYVMSSFSEGFSNTMAEAMANAVPVLSYKVNPDNIFERYKIGYCAEGNKKKFFEQFEKMNNNKLLAEKMGNNGRIYIEKNHNKNKIVKKLAKILLDD